MRKRALHDAVLLLSFHLENLQAIKISQVKHGFGGWWFGHELAMFSVEIPLLHVAYGILHLLTSLSMSMICQTLFAMLASASGFLRQMRSSLALVFVEVTAYQAVGENVT